MLSEEDHRICLFLLCVCVTWIRFVFTTPVLYHHYDFTSGQSVCLHYLRWNQCWFSEDKYRVVWPFQFCLSRKFMSSQDVCYLILCLRLLGRRERWFSFAYSMLNKRVRLRKKAFLPPSTVLVFQPLILFHCLSFLTCSFILSFLLALLLSELSLSSFSDSSLV